MRKRSVAGLVLLFVALAAAPALAHVTVQPEEAVAGSFARFVVRVPNERDDAATTKIKVSFPPLAFVSFMPIDGWKRTSKTVTFNEPVIARDTEITEGIGSVTWRGGRIGPSEFEEFGFSALVPEDETTLTFEAIQTYSSGEVVRWRGAPDSEEPAARVETVDIGAGENEGELAVLAELNDEVAEDDDGGAVLPIIVAVLALVAALIAVALSYRTRHA